MTKRDYAPESEWRNWVWRSEGDLFMNGAFFTQSGQQNMKARPSHEYMIQANPGEFAARMTRYAGALECVRGKKC